jgi:hypothetical protein
MKIKTKKLEDGTTVVEGMTSAELLALAKKRAIADDGTSSSWRSAPTRPPVSRTEKRRCSARATSRSSGCGRNRSRSATAIGNR